MGDLSDANETGDMDDVRDPSDLIDPFGTEVGNGGTGRMDAAGRTADGTNDVMRRAREFSTMLDHNVALRAPAMAALSACEHRRPLAEVIDEVHASLEAAHALPLQPVSSIVDVLVRAGVVDKTLEVDGKPYDGTLRDAMGDETLPDDAALVEFVTINEVGRLAQRLNAPERRVHQLFRDRPHLLAGLLATLRLCAAEPGMGTRDLQEELDGLGLLERDERTGLPTLYPSAFCNALKDVGALEWRDHNWVTTELGRGVLDAQAAV